MNPQTLDQTLKIALSVQEAERHEKFSESFYANFDDSSRLRSPSPTRSVGNKPRRSVDVKRLVNHTQAQRHRAAGNDRESKSYGNRNAQTKASLKCYECGAEGHYARECATRLRKRPTPLTHTEGGIRPNAQGTRDHPVMIPATLIEIGEPAPSFCPSRRQQTGTTRHIYICGEANPLFGLRFMASVRSLLWIQDPAFH